MDILKDDVHHCDECDIYPCSLQKDVSKSDICGDCPVHCCRSVIIPLAPCEQSKLESNGGLGLKMKDDEWCWYHDDNKGCTIYDKRPVMCRVASCRFICEGKIPDEIKKINEKRKKNMRKGE